MKNLLFLILCLSVTTLSAQQNNTANWTHHQALDEVNDIAETETDMWFATNTGLVRMNKTTLDKTIYHPYNSPLPKQHIEAVTVDADGQLFIGIYDNIMARFDGNNDWDIIDLPSSSSTDTPLLFTIFIDDENEKWVGTSIGLLHYQADGTWETFNDETLGNTSISFRDVWDITQTDNGDLFISSFEIYKYDGTDFTNLSEGNNDLFSYANTSIESVGDEVWFNNSQFLNARYADESWTIYEAGENGLPSGSMSDIRINQMGTPFVAYSAAGVGVYKFENDVWTSADDAQINGISQGLSSIYFDENNDRWLTVGGDVFYSNSTTDTQILLQESPLMTNPPSFVKEAPDGSVYGYSGTFFGGKLVKLSSPTEWETIALSDAFSTVNDMEVNSNGDLVISTVQGLFQYGNGTWTEISGFPAAIPKQIALDSEDGIWVTTSLDGLHHYDGSTWTSYNSASSDLSSDFLGNIWVDRNDDVWLVSESQNLEHFNGTNWEIFNESNSPLSSLSLGRDLYFDENNELWFPEYSGGIFHYDGTTWEEFFIESVSLTQYKITADQDGVLYVATEWGIYQFNGSTWQPFLNEENSLLLDNENTDILIGQNGYFWISTLEGLFIYNSEVISAINEPEILDQSFFTIFPNPSVDFISIKLENTTVQNFEANIYDATGRLLHNEKINISEQVRVMDLPKGIYYLKLDGEESSYISKFVKE